VAERDQRRSVPPYPFPLLYLSSRHFPQKWIAERSAKKDMTQYLLTIEMVENDYSVFFYLADIFTSRRMGRDA
jgi:hypothetical protein